MVKETASKILGRETSADEGMPVSAIEEAEVRLGSKLPYVLKEYYTAVGNIQLFMSDYNRFAMPDELYIQDGKLVFLEENQCVCMWAVDIKEAGYDNPTVYMLLENDEGCEYFPEEITLSEFLRLMLYYQVAQGDNSETDGGYIYTGTIDGDMPDELSYMLLSWEKTVDYNGFTVYMDSGRMIWYLSDNESKPEVIVCQTRSEDDLNWMAERFGFNAV